MALNSSVAVPTRKSTGSRPFIAWSVASNSARTAFREASNPSEESAAFPNVSCTSW
jgi:hypothetical protein